MKDKQVAKDIIEIEFPNSNIRDIIDVSGMSHAVYIVELEGRDVVISYCYEEVLEHRFEVAAEVTKLVSEKTDVPVPEIHSVDLSKEKVPYMYFTMERIKGEAMSVHGGKPDFRRFSREKKTEILEQVGRYLGRIHRNIQFDSYGNISYDLESNQLEIDQKEDWGDGLRALIDEQIVDLKEEVHTDRFSDLVPEIEEFLDEFEYVIEDDFTPVLVHQDYLPHNIMVLGLKVTGIVDWERAGSGHKEYDFFKTERGFINSPFSSEKVKKRLRKHLYKGYRETNELGEGWKMRREFYRFIYFINKVWAYPGIVEGWSKEEKDEFEDELRDQFYQIKETTSKNLRTETPRDI